MTTTQDYVDEQTAEYCRQQGNPYAIVPVIKVIQWVLEFLKGKEKAGEVEDAKRT